jgi:WD40 repeat protein
MRKIMYLGLGFEAHVCMFLLHTRREAFCLVATSCCSRFACCDPRAFSIDTCIPVSLGDMAAGGVHQLAQCITCHAWNADLSMVAVCPNNNEVHIYQASPSPTSAWECIHVLQKHDQLVSGIDWAPMSNKIVTSSHDRNSYVWTLEGNEWQPTLVILRLNRAAISVDWSPRGGLIIDFLRHSLCSGEDGFVLVVQRAF